MSDLVVDGAAVEQFASRLAAGAHPVGATCVATGHAVGSGVVQDALADVSLVLEILDAALADGSAALARDARVTAAAWDASDARLVMRAV